METILRNWLLEATGEAMYFLSRVSISCLPSSSSGPCPESDPQGGLWACCAQMRGF